MSGPANFDYNYSAILSGTVGVAASQAVGRLSWTAPVRVATTVAGTLATSFENGDTVDGVVLATGDRILIKNQAAGAENGIYVVAASGAPVRATDYDSEVDVLGSVIVVTNGTANAASLWQMTTIAPITVGTTALVFAQVTGATFATPAIVLGTAAAAGVATTVIRSDSTIVAFDATVPVTQAFGDAAATGSAAIAARRDHVHGMPAASGGLLGSITAASAAIANTETVVVSATLAANSMVAGSSFRIRAAGVGTTGLAPGVDTFRIRIGTTTLTGNIPCSVAPPANTSVTAQPFLFEALVTVRTAGAGGTIIGECIAVADDAATGLFTLLVDLSAVTATVAVDTTASKLLELTFQSGAASSSATFHVATIEVLTAGGVGVQPGFQYDYVQITANASITATTEGTANTAITGTSITYDGSTKVNIEAFAALVNPDSGALGRSMSVILVDSVGTTVLGRLLYTETVVLSRPVFIPLSATMQVTPSAGAHAYSVRAFVSAGTGTINAGAGGAGANPPAFVRITKV